MDEGCSHRGCRGASACTVAVWVDVLEFWLRRPYRAWWMDNHEQEYATCIRRILRAYRGEP